MLAVLAALVVWLIVDVVSRSVAPVVAVAIAVALGIVTVLVFVRAGRAWARRADSRRRWAAGDHVGARRAAAGSREAAWSGLGLAGFMAVVVVAALFVTANNSAVAATFFQWDLIRSSFGDIARALSVNLIIALGAQLLSSALGLLLALARLLPSRSARPLRLLAIGYIDLFRGLPSIVVIYLVCFGVPIAGIPVISEAPPMLYAVVALSLTYGAYNAELFRSGIESVHASQTSAALSLGLSPFSVNRLIVLPQVMRRIAPALLSAFVALQKDTALVNVVGIVDSFTQAKIFASNMFNLSAVTVVCILFVIITIPQTRLVDYLIARTDSRTRGRS
ncbi:ABC transporter permease subunit [Micromonospora sp. NPDC023633]|uniref:amino acid ABC transporter permease n=1 Tax=Micromonospora sp. NPDC023633 TaxID=3154320 RepID=UPI0033ECED59